MAGVTACWRGIRMPARRHELLLRAVISLRQRKGNGENAREQEEVKRTSNQVRFDSGMKLFFHRGVVGGGGWSLEEGSKRVLSRERQANRLQGKIFNFGGLSSAEPEWLRNRSGLTTTLDFPAGN